MPPLYGVSGIGTPSGSRCVFIGYRDVRLLGGAAPALPTLAPSLRAPSLPPRKLGESGLARSFASGSFRSPRYRLGVGWRDVGRLGCRLLRWRVLRWALPPDPLHAAPSAAAPSGGSLRFLVSFAGVWGSGLRPSRSASASLPSRGPRPVRVGRGVPRPSSLLALGLPAVALAPSQCSGLRHSGLSRQGCGSLHGRPCLRNGAAISVRQHPCLPFPSLSLGFRLSRCSPFAAPLPVSLSLSVVMLPPAFGALGSGGVRPLLLVSSYAIALWGLRGVSPPRFARASSLSSVGASAAFGGIPASVREAL